MSDFSKAKFLELLKKGMGTRSQAAFARETGISPVHLNRLINMKTENVPTRDTLISMASCMYNVSLNELFEACGYEKISLQEMISIIENDIDVCLQSILENGKIVSDTSSVMDELVNKCIASRSTYRQRTEETSVDGSVNGSAGADYRCEYFFSWKFNEYTCGEIIDFFYVKSDKGRIVVLSAKMREGKTEGLNGDFFKKGTYARARVEDSAEARMIRSLFGEAAHDIVSGKELVKYPVTLPGIGFHYGDLGDHFLPFLIKNAAFYCTGTEKRKVFQAIAAGKQPEEIDSFITKDPEYFRADAIASILTERTGLGFENFSEKEGDEISTLIISKFQNQEITKIPIPVLSVLYEAAKDLGVQEFGVVYRFETILRETSQIFKTSNFYLTEK